MHWFNIFDNIKIKRNSFHMTLSFKKNHQNSTICDPISTYSSNIFPLVDDAVKRVLIDFYSSKIMPIKKLKNIQPNSMFY